MATGKKIGCITILLSLAAATILLKMLGKGIEKSVELTAPKPPAAENMETKTGITHPDKTTKPIDQLQQHKPEPPSLTPAERLAAAKKALAEKSKDHPYGILWEAENHLKEIPIGAKEHKEAQRLMKEIERRRKKLFDTEKEREIAFFADIRKEYADTLERNFLEKGYDVTATISEKGGTTLKIKWVLISRPMLYNLLKDGHLIQKWKEMGFKKVIFTDGYRYTWTYDLTK